MGEAVLAGRPGGSRGHVSLVHRGRGRPLKTDCRCERCEKWFERAEEAMIVIALAMVWIGGALLIKGCGG